MRKLLTFLSFSFLSLLRSLSFRKKVFQISYFIFTFTLSILNLSFSGFSKEEVQYLKKVGEIKEGFSSEKENFFIKITGLCCDDEGNLYVADSGWNKIFKFDPNGKFIMSFGRQGQGPGEFMAQRLTNLIDISFGNDKKLYVTDPGNGRISIFAKDGKFIRQLKVSPLTYDAPAVNSKGDLYLLSQSGIKVIDRYDSNLKYKSSLLDIDLHYKFPYGKPAELDNWLNIRKPLPFECFKLITKKDEIVILSNNSLKIFVFDEKDHKLNEFAINERRFVEDYKKIMKDLKRKKGVYFPPFFPFLDKDDNICLHYGGWYGDKNEIYVYKISGQFLKILKLQENFTPIFITSNRVSKLYFASPTEIKIFRN